MSDNSRFVAGGGWVTRKRQVKPMSSVVAVIALVWSLGCIYSASCLILDSYPRSSPSGKLACWAAVGLMPMFVIIAIIVWRKEKPREISVRVPNPDYDIRNLYFGATLRRDERSGIDKKAQP